MFFFFQAEDGIRDLVRSRGLGDVYKRQAPRTAPWLRSWDRGSCTHRKTPRGGRRVEVTFEACLLYTSDAADERSSVDLGGRRIIKKKTTARSAGRRVDHNKQTHTRQDER